MLSWDIYEDGYDPAQHETTVFISKIGIVVRSKRFT
jgi:hypothetical protein